MYPIKFELRCRRREVNSAVQTGLSIKAMTSKYTPQLILPPDAYIETSANINFDMSMLTLLIVTSIRLKLISVSFLINIVSFDSNLIIEKCIQSNSSCDVGVEKSIARFRFI